jgi:hypothetical protein
MRALELAKVAAAAEALRVKRYARRQGIRVGLAAGALLFIVTFFAMIHVLAIILLGMVAPLWAAMVIVLVVDLVVGGVLGLTALSNKPDQIELEAAAVRRQSLTEAKKAATSLATIGEVAGLAIGMTGRRRAQTSRVGRAWLIADVASRFFRKR